MQTVENHTSINSDWKAFFFFFFKEHDLVIALEKPVMPPQQFFPDPRVPQKSSVIHVLRDWMPHEDILLLLGKSINKGTGCISGAYWEYREKHKNTVFTLIGL